MNGTVVNGHGKEHDIQKCILTNAFYKDLLPVSNVSKVTEDFIVNIVQKLVDYLDKSNDRNEKIIEFISPDKLQTEVNFSLPDHGESLGDICDHVDQILKYAVKTAHPRYYNQLWAGVDVTCMLGEWITAATNTSMFTYEVAPVYLIMEKFVMEKILDIVPYPNGEGFFFPGGSIANMSALCLARYRYYPEIKEKGMYGCKVMKIYISEEAHYSLSKFAAQLGFGTNNLIKIKTDESGKMNCEDLEQKILKDIEENAHPLMVCATGGTTVAGAYDPFNEIANICEKYDMWMHIDACWGGGCLFSEKHKHLMSGCHRADSISFCPHKLLNALLQCSLLMIKRKGLLKECNQFKAQYLFQKDKKLYDVKLDTGDKTFQCGRRNDALKLWLMWKVKGTAGIEAQVDNAFANSMYLADQIKLRKNRFVLVRKPECTNVLFYYIPPSLRDLPDGQEKRDALNKIPAEIKKRMTLDGTLMIGYQPYKIGFNIFRMINGSPAVNFSDMDFILNEIERLGNDL